MNCCWKNRIRSAHRGECDRGHICLYSLTDNNGIMTINGLNLGREIAEATKDVFSTMIMMELKSEPPIEGKGGSILSNISSMIGLGGQVRGMLGIHCPEQVAKAITSSFLGMDVEELDEDVKDAIGELANMVAGNLKVFFADQGIDAVLAIPTSVIGKAYRTSGIAGATRILAPFTTSDGTFWVELIYVLNT